ncbi:hypothetical protein C7377_0576 [Balneicella halophila]|uniref:Lysylphosphatidylglycerol synthase-like protein n=1 Tax=Balneicella halophila TaxID=1537566 RepID=A0A7L4USQ1_BALHA|nr:lysylphosphatidylglycerol synthase transmembrane domain-containing protein [Balneicella halophila]PVX52267.1 hypothetical protein C7377_0576 [Balneicella halophila]
MFQGKFKEVVKFILFLSFGVGIFWLVYRKQDPEKLWGAFKDVNLFWLAMTVIVMLISHVSRSIRWMMLVEPLGKKVSFWNATFSTFLGYFANMALPRMGEVMRCAVLGKYEDIPTSKLLGTVVVERAIDVVLFLLCLILAIALQFDVFTHLGSEYLTKSNNEEETSYLWVYITVGVVAVLLLLYFIFRRKIHKTKIYCSVKKFLKNIIKGFRTIWQLKSFNAFLFHSLLIWVCYYLMMYFGFQVFEFTSELSGVVALSIFVLGSLGMILPAPGGIGAFHFFVISGLVLYLPAESNINEKAAAFALLIHGVQTLFIIISGVVSLVLLPIINTKKKTL